MNLRLLYCKIGAKENGNFSLLPQGLKPVYLGTCIGKKQKLFLQPPTFWISLGKKAPQLLAKSSTCCTILPHISLYGIKKGSAQKP
ncbi:MAG: hypothetical protein IJU79_02025 [Desulfovibrionaceae bacterium]|nr:hypothetical protein [Desulfovibrionaceae bacterium]